MITLATKANIPCLDDMIRAGLKKALPVLSRNTHDPINKIMTDLMTGAAHIWVASDKSKEDFIGFMITYIVRDETADSRNLLMYCLCTVPGKVLTDAIIEEGCAHIFKFAEQEKCDNVDALVLEDSRMQPWIDTVERNKESLGFNRYFLYRKEL